MNYSNVILLICDDARAIRVSYEDNSKTTIKKTIDPHIKKGDYVVVETGTRWNMTVCKVVETDVEVDFDSDEELGWIIERVDMDRFDNIKVQETAAIQAIKEDEKRKKREAIQAQLRDVTNPALSALPIYDMDKED